MAFKNKRKLFADDTCPLAYFHKTLVNSKPTHKHLGMILDSKLSCEKHLQSVFSRVSKIIGRAFENISTYSSKKIFCGNLLIIY